MTYFPISQSKVDNNNTISYSGTSFIGTSTQTTGFSNILLTIDLNVNSDASGIQIQFSDDNSTFTTYYTDTYFSGIKYTKEFEILKKYYKIRIDTPSGTGNVTSRLITSSKEKNKFSYNNDSIYDAFSKLRVSNPLTLLDIKFPSQSTGTPEFLENNILVTNKTSGSYFATYGNSKCVINGTGDGSFISQSRKYCVYQPGKSLLFLGSGIIYSGTGTGFKSRIGYFDDENGVFFEYNSNTGISVVLRNNSIDTIISQDDWNIDKMDGSGTNGFNLDFTKCQLFVIDLEWLGVGRVRYGFFIFGKIYYCHQIVNINSLNDVYMINPNLPIRYELIGSETSGSSELTQICSSVISEGGYNPFGRPFSINNGINEITVATTETPILTIRGGTNYNHQNIIPTNIVLFGTSNTNLLYRIRLYQAGNSPGTITWSSVNDNSLVEYSTSISSFTTNNSIIVDSGYFAGKTNSTITPLSNIFSNFIQITSDIDNVSDILVITAQTLSSNAEVLCSIDWQEFY